MSMLTKYHKNNVNFDIKEQMFNKNLTKWYQYHA
jgi:hypothetical protein